VTRRPGYAVAMAATRWFSLLGAAVWAAGILATWQLFGPVLAGLLWVVLVPATLVVLAHLCDPELASG
jgi:hypothetical protein